ncbi:hypothetical protein GCM10008107_14560 [Psychrosphaera saromensis]|nr:hypothetical protein [Psychrosphaera saromensis]GHB66447.1 hypothetical protein GCM10008107_14560 [Psychrosphaera saromensis]GLQ14912.1 hypothetical protein GCM10007917_23670 [Psychrosphaera saromensis]
MRELNVNEIEQVNGGISWTGAARMAVKYLSRMPSFRGPSRYNGEWNG